MGILDRWGCVNQSCGKRPLAVELRSGAIVYGLMYSATRVHTKQAKKSLYSLGRKGLRIGIGSLAYHTQHLHYCYHPPPNGFICPET
jgi:uncharacterized membrane protein YebE (DUF533 family)